MSLSDSAAISPRQLAATAVSRYRIGQRVSVLSPFDRSHGVPAREGRIVGAAIQSDPHGIEGTLTVDLGAGCHEYAPPSWVEPIEPVYATFAHMQPDFKGGEFRMYQVHGGERDRSTLSEATVRALGIRIQADGR